MNIHNIFFDNQLLGEVWFRKNKTMMVIIDKTGKVIACNDTFLQWIGYSEYEFQRDNNPVTWWDISINDGAGDADKVLFNRCFDGNIDHYSLRKQIVPNGSSPHLVDIFGLGFPPIEETKFILLEIYDLKNGTKRAFEELLILQQNTTKSLESISESLKIVEQNLISKFTIWVSEKPVVLIFLFLLFSFLIFGRSVLEILIMVQSIIK